MKKAMIVIAALMMSQTAFGATRYNLFDMTTSEARQLIKDRGAVLFNTNAKKPYIFERLVDSRFDCFGSDEVTKAFFGYTADSGNRKDRVGRVCEEYQNGK